MSTCINLEGKTVGKVEKSIFDEPKYSCKM